MIQEHWSNIAMDGNGQHKTAHVLANAATPTGYVDPDIITVYNLFWTVAERLNNFRACLRLREYFGDHRRWRNRNYYDRSVYGSEPPRHW